MTEIQIWGQTKGNQLSRKGKEIIWLKLIIVRSDFVMELYGKWHHYFLKISILIQWGTVNKVLTPNNIRAH